jgi:hypothetical protein
MEMYLVEIPVYTIMLIGRRLSNALLCYIRKKVEHFFLNIAKKMLTFWSTHHILDITSRHVTHSLQSGAAMKMYLGEIPVYIIMLISRWSSDAFLCYIRIKVEQFLRNVAKKMLTF